jgi:ParB-like chromosome segregation protein Spo0J
MTISWKITSVNVKSIKKHPSNPRILSKMQADQLKKSLDKFGLIDKPILNQDFTLIGGHQRFDILKKQGAKEIDCQIPDRLLTEDEVRELMIRMNRNHGNWDYDLLANEWEIPDLLEYGFNPEELLGSMEEIEEKEDKPKKKEKLCPHCQMPLK